MAKLLENLLPAQCEQSRPIMLEKVDYIRRYVCSAGFISGKHAVKQSDIMPEEICGALTYALNDYSNCIM